MTDLDSLLADARTHRAVADPEMTARVAQRALLEFRKESPARLRRVGRLPHRRGTRVNQQQAAALFAKWLPTPRLVRVSALATVICALGVAAFWIAMQSGALQRLDILAKFWARDLAYSVGNSMRHAPLLTSCFFASAACALGFASSRRARQGARTLLHS